jgi:methionyl-tRNA formyltransferase
MNKKSLRIIYMGTPDFAVAPLQRLLDSGEQVVAVITAPDRPAGRGKKIRYSAVKQYILDKHPHIPLLQPTNLKDPSFVDQVQLLKPEIQIVVAFRMLPEVIWQIPQIGTFNLHASLLPQYRGAAPINHALINGEAETGVTTFMIDHKIDTGRILMQEKVVIGDSERAGELHDRLMEAGAHLVMETVTGLTQGSLQTRSQADFMGQGGELKKAPKIFKEDCRIEWEQSGEKVFNQIRGLSPYPGAFSHLQRKTGDPVLYKIYSAFFRPDSHQESPGTVQTNGKTELEVAVPGGWIQVLHLQQEGKRRMEIRDFLAGTNLTTGLCRFS